MVTEAVHCELCHLPTFHPLTNEEGDMFCCPACLEVTALLAEPTSPHSNQVKSEVGPDETETTTVSLSGLWCPSCAWLISERLERTTGVQAAGVNFIRREALVTYDPGQTSPRQITRQIKRIGYGARLEGEKPYNEEESQWTKLLINGVLVMHVMVLSFMLYLRQWTGRDAAETQWLADYFEIMISFISLPVILMLGLPILRAGAASLLRGRPNTHTLIALGSFAAVGLSVRNLLMEQGGVYFDTAAILLFLMALGRWLELRAQKVSRRTVERIWQQIPPEATWFAPDGWETRPVDEIPLGARVRVRPGDRFPVDALVAAGEGDVDESVVTGEPDPVLRGVGNKVLAGSVNLDGAFEVIVTAVGANTVVGQIGRLLHEALWERAPVERLADKLAAWMVPLAVTLSLATFAIWTWLADMETGLIYALSVLLIACPCALGIATPLTLWIGLGRATRAGVILRHTGVIEQLADIRQIYFDKTGTLTKRPVRLQHLSTNGVDEPDFLARVAAVESQSEHPIGQAIVNGAEQDFGIRRPAFGVSNFRSFPGRGVTATIENDPIWVGNRSLMHMHCPAIPSELEETANAWRQDDLIVVYAGWHEQVQGVLGLGEVLREEAVDTISQLLSLDLTVTVLTGDDRNAADRWQEELGVPVYAEQRPEDKVTRLQAAIAKVAMVGDGINDGPALAAAAVGIAVPQGADLARSTADVVLIHEDLQTIPRLIILARATMQKVRQNLAWAVIYNGFGLLLAVAGLLQPSLAALLMVISNLVVTTNALRLRNIEIEGWRQNDDDDPLSSNANLRSEAELLSPIKKMAYE